MKVIVLSDNSEPSFLRPYISKIFLITLIWSVEVNQCRPLMWALPYLRYNNCKYALDFVKLSKVIDENQKIDYAIYFRITEN